MRADLVPDDLWERVAPLLPPAPERAATPVGCLFQTVQHSPASCTCCSNDAPISTRACSNWPSASYASAACEPHSETISKPDNTAKGIPGQSAKSPLNRLYRDADRRKKNRAQAIRTCEQHWGRDYSQNNTYQCDEFPFATTYQGAAQTQFEPNAPKNNYSAMPLVTADNRDAGILLGQFMTKNRIIDGKDDGFLVKIL